MFRFSIREMMLVTLVVALLGCKSKPATAPRPSAAPIAEVTVAEQQITKEQAIEIVRQDLAKNRNLVFDCKASESQDGFRVSVEFGSERDENGQLQGRFPGGHCSYVVSKSGKIIEVHPGA
jgi:hypothetical protein